MGPEFTRDRADHGGTLKVECRGPRVLGDEPELKFGGEKPFRRSVQIAHPSV